MKQNKKAPAAAVAKTYEGTPAKRLNAPQELRRAVASCLLWEDQFYEGGSSIADRIRELTLNVAPNVAADMARAARSDYKLRHVPLWIARNLAAGSPEQRAVVDDLLYEIIQRPDELAEFLALYWKDGKQPIAASVKRGLARAFTKFDAYSLAKYNRDEAIKLRDVMFMVHAKPENAAQAATWKQLIEGTLPVPDTWETQLSAGKDKRATWTRLLEERKLGALALLRNLRNMQQAGVSLDLIKDSLGTCNVERVLPFRFISAARYAPQLERELEAAMYRCLLGMPKLEGKTALVVDTSPSMWMAKVSARSELDRFDAAAALAILCSEMCEQVNVYAFNHKAHVVPARRGFALRDALAATKGEASCGGLAVEQANKDGYDRIVVLTDGEWHYPNYTKRSFGAKTGKAEAVSPAPLTDKAYLINVASYKNAIGSSKWTMIDGWSESILDYIKAVETLD